ncbi:MAG: Nuclease [Ferruginibacter sp.]|nr:Nuclease [Ferruginibacter sp.]
MSAVTRKIFLLSLCCFFSCRAFCWGFWAHQQINYLAVFLLPPEMLVLYKPQIEFLKEHAVDPDKRRYAVTDEAPRHYLDIDHYGNYPYDSLPKKWSEAAEKFSEDSLKKYGIVPWHIQTMLARLTKAFKEQNFSGILKNSAELGHYIADAHVPLHASSNHNGQLTGQKGIHAFWESRIPELLAEKEFDFFIGQAAYIKDPLVFTWNRLLESARAADTVLLLEKNLSRSFPADQKYSFEPRNGLILKQFSSAFSTEYNRQLNGMVERRMRQAIFAIASFWYTAWVNAGQPDLKHLSGKTFSDNDQKEFDDLNKGWQAAAKMIGREE